VVLALIHHNSALDRRVLVRFGVLAAVVFAAGREFDWLWAAMALVLCLASVSISRWRGFLSSRPARLVIGCVVAAAAVTELWSVTFKSYVFYPVHSPPLGLVAAARASLDGTTKLLGEMLGNLGRLTLPPPTLADVCWVLVVVAIVAIGFASGARTGLVVAAGVTAVFAIPFAIGLAGYVHRRTAATRAHARDRARPGRHRAGARRPGGCVLQRLGEVPGHAAALGLSDRGAQGRPACRRHGGHHGEHRRSGPPVDARGR
jgi:hypothetical protein